MGAMNLWAILVQSRQRMHFFSLVGNHPRLVALMDVVYDHQGRVPAEEPCQIANLAPASLLHPHSIVKQKSVRVMNMEFVASRSNH